MPRNIRLKLAYDGTNYCGWQVQKNGPSLQTALERAIEKLTGEKCPVLSAGRTDSGVHALGQVANFYTSCAIPAGNFRPALQAFLPHDIVVLESSEAAPDFHATFKATRKHYRYVIDNSPVPLPFFRGYTWSLRRRLDDMAMHEAAQLLLGKHDFRSFETDWPNKVTSVRTVFEIGVVRRPVWEVFAASAEYPVPSTQYAACSAQYPGANAPGAAPSTQYSVPSAQCGVRGSRLPAGDTAESSPADRAARAGAPAQGGDMICVDIIADGFLYNMVRSIVGTLVNVGRQKWPREEVSRILAAQDRSIAGSTAPACGLFLVQVWYE